MFVKTKLANYKSIEMNKYYKLNNCNWYGRDTLSGSERISCYKHMVGIEVVKDRAISTFTKDISGFKIEEISEYSYNRIRRYVLNRINQAK